MSNQMRDIPPRPSIIRTRRSMKENTLWSMSGEGVRMISGLGVFVILSRLYEPAQFGALVAVTALFEFLLPQSSLGSGWLLLKRVSGDGWDPERAMARATGSVLAGGSIVFVVMLLLHPYVLPQVSLGLFAAVGLIELFLVGITEAALFSAQAMENLKVKAVVWSAHGIGRLTAAIGLLLFTEEPSMELWVLMLGIVAFGVAVLANVSAFGRLVVPVPPKWSDFRLGLPFSIGFGADRLRETADNVMLVNADKGLDAGLYAAGRRLINVFSVPIVALTHAMNGRFFELGAKSRRATARLAVKVCALASAYGLVAALLLWSLSDQISLVLPGSYRETSSVIALAALLPLLYALEVFPATALTASGLHPVRIVLNFATTGLNVFLNILWIPTYGWEGAIGATFVSGGLYAVALWTALGIAARREQSGDPETGLSQAEGKPTLEEVVPS